VVFGSNPNDPELVGAGAGVPQQLAPLELGVVVVGVVAEGLQQLADGAAALGE
jgi:X-X-X-Leu-X-X-Gly heptad repeat protein